MTILSFDTVYWIPLTSLNGLKQMSLDDALLDWVRHKASPKTLVIRCYEWNEPTVSFGVHQSLKSMSASLSHYSETHPSLAFIKRPTGGRAILHGDDVSYAFISNHPQLLAMSLTDSYCVFSQWVRFTLETLNIQVICDSQSTNTAYSLSDLCFNTHMPSDFLDTQGQKITGASQLRRQGGLLQHGTAFLSSFFTSNQQFADTLRHHIEDQLSQPLHKLDPTHCMDLMALWQVRQVAYETDFANIAVKLSTTSGSHLLPASD